MFKKYSLINVKIQIVLKRDTAIIRSMIGLRYLKIN